MIIIIAIFLLSGLIEQTSTIQCYTCSELGNHCPLPLNLDGGDESNENDIDTFNYNPGYACLSDHSLDPRTGKEKLILRGIDVCTDLNIPNRRIHCCYTNNCNKQVPPMTVKTLADIRKETVDIESNCRFNLPSIILICLTISLQYFYFKI